MNIPTYKEQFDKITIAYLGNKINPLDGDFCFCGTLVGGDEWMEDDEYDGYSSIEYAKMESALLTPLIPYGVWVYNEDELMPGNWAGMVDDTKEGYENALFQGMCDALDVLKQIHELHGEIIDPIPFKKRELVKA